MNREMAGKGLSLEGARPRAPLYGARVRVLDISGATLFLSNPPIRPISLICLVRGTRGRAPSMLNAQSGPCSVDAAT